MGLYGWSFFAVNAEGAERQVFPAAQGSLAYDGTRDVSKTLSGMIFLPGELSKFDLAADQVRVVFSLDGVDYPMGFYSAIESTRQKDVLLDPETNLVSDISTIGFGDRLSRLIRSDGKPQTIQGGFDPSQEAIDLLLDTEIPFGWEGSVSPAGDTIVWDGATTLLSKVVQLSELGGHRNPWMDNDGVVRSVVAQTPVPTDPRIIDLMKTLFVEANSLAITETFLSAPNVVVVTGNAGNSDAPATGRWDAPSIAPHSFANRGYFYTQMVSRQGLRDSAHATRVAEAIGEMNAARMLSFRCRPTSILDGPVTLRYDDTLWVVNSWSIDLGPNGTMDVQAQELTADPLYNVTYDSEEIL
jgi:hypothetical protein